MHTFEQQIIIDRPVQDVFDFISDPLNSPHWQTGVETVEWISTGSPGVGSTWKATTKFMGRSIEATMEVTSWDPPRQTGMKAVSGPVPFELTMHLAGEGSGTRLTVQGKAELGGFFKLAEGLVGRQLDKQMKSDFLTLKSVLEKE